MNIGQKKNDKASESKDPSDNATCFQAHDAANPIRCRNELFPAYECGRSPRMRELREQYGLDQVVAGIDDEFERILALRHWIRSVIEIENDNPTPTRPNAFAILDAALAGGKFHCAHYSIVQHAVLNSFGYVSRRMQCGPGRKEKGGCHGVNEVWVNPLAKWVLVDAKYDLHFEKDGRPLSALEIRDEVWHDNAKSVMTVTGPERCPVQASDGLAWEQRTATYRWCAWETNTNRFTAYPNAGTSTIVVLADERFKTNTWYRDGKPHWAYGTPFLLETTRRDWIEWTPNVISSNVKPNSASVRIELVSFTPNFDAYQIRETNAEWRHCADQLELPLEKNGGEWTFRTMNLFGVAGPEHRIIIRPA